MNKNNKTSDNLDALLTRNRYRRLHGADLDTMVGILRHLYKWKAISSSGVKAYMVCRSSIASSDKYCLIAEYVDGDYYEIAYTTLKSAAKMHNAGMYKSVNMYDLDGHYIATYPSCRAAADALGVPYSNVYESVSRNGRCFGNMFRRAAKVDGTSDIEPYWMGRR